MRESNRVFDELSIKLDSNLVFDAEIKTLDWFLYPEPGRSDVTSCCPGLQAGWRAVGQAGGRLAFQADQGFNEFY